MVCGPLGRVPCLGIMISYYYLNYTNRTSNDLPCKLRYNNNHYINLCNIILDN